MIICKRGRPYIAGWRAIIDTIVVIEVVDLNDNIHLVRSETAN